MSFLPLLAIVGPTGAGKSEFAMALAQRFHGEVVNADSRQLYRLMDIGTAKPPPEARQRILHHLYDVALPRDPLGLARYLDTARPLIADVQRRGALPVVVGGSGQYVWALLEGWTVPHVPPDTSLRQQLEREAAAHGAERLHQRLHQVDPAAAAAIDPRNVRRVVRALEVHHTTGQRFSQAKRKACPPFRPLVLGLTTRTRQQLQQVIDWRVEAMLQQGWLQEVQTLLDAGYGSSPVFRASMGYPDLARVLAGELTLEKAKALIQVAHHRLVRRQYTWFRRSDLRIHWLEVSEGAREQAEELVARFLEHPTSPAEGEADNQP